MNTLTTTQESVYMELTQIKIALEQAIEQRDYWTSEVTKLQLQLVRASIEESRRKAEQLSKQEKRDAIMKALPGQFANFRDTEHGALLYHVPMRFLDKVRETIYTNTDLTSKDIRVMFRGPRYDSGSAFTRKEDATSFSLYVY